MAVVPADQRLEMLKRLGMSEALIRQSAGEQLHELFWYRCKGPPSYCYHLAGCPEGAEFAPLWDCSGLTTGIWCKQDLEFIEFSIEDPDDYWVLAHTEQGLWATIFADVFADNDNVELQDLEESARLVGFRYLSEVISSCPTAQYDGFEQHDARLRQLVADIDRNIWHY